MKFHIRLIAAVLVLNSSNSIASEDDAVQVRKLVSEVLAGINMEDFAHVATLFHYPKSWSEAEVIFDQCHMEHNLRYLAERYGKLLAAVDMQNDRNYLDLSVVSANDEYWAQNIETLKLKLDARFEKEGEQVLVIEVAKIDHVIKLKAIGYGTDIRWGGGILKFNTLREEFISARIKRGEEGVCKSRS